MESDKVASSSSGKLSTADLSSNKLGKLRKAANMVARVNKFTGALKEGADKAAANTVAPVNAAPPCLSKVLSQLRAKDRNFASDAKGKRRILNQRFVNSLFISNIDTEEVEAAMINFDYDLGALTTVEGRCYVPSDMQYQTTSKSRYDARKNQIVFSTSMTMLESHGDSDSVLSNSSRSIASQEVRVETPKFSLIKDRTPDPMSQHVPTSYELSKKLAPDLAKTNIHRLIETTTKKELKKAEEAAKELHIHHHSHSEMHHNHSQYIPKRTIPTITTITGEKMPITREESEHYFGDVARIHFYDRMRKIMAKMNQLAPFGPNQKYLRHAGEESEETRNEKNDLHDINSSMHFQDDNSTIMTSVTLSAVLGQENIQRTVLSRGTKSSLSGSSSAISSVYDPTLPPSIAVKMDDIISLNGKIGIAAVQNAPSTSDSRMSEAPFLGLSSSSASLASTFGAFQTKQLPPLSSSSVVSASQDTHVNSSVHSLSSEFFAELGSLASNDHVKRRVDRDILAVPKQRKNPHLLSTPNSRLPSNSMNQLNANKKSKRGRKINLAPLHRDKVNLDSSIASPLQQKRLTENETFQQLVHQEQQVLQQLKEQEKKKKQIQLATVSHSQQIDSSTSSTPVTPLLYQHHQQQHQQSSIIPITIQSSMLSQSLSENVPVSPRTRYITHCIQAGLTPLPHLIIRREFTTILNLAHYALGDGMGRILAYCLSDLPYLEHIDLNDNQLTDDSLQYIIQAIIAIPTIRVLNLSRNKIDGYSSTALAEYVARPDCPIESLILQSADVDDGECADFVQNLVTNEKLVELDLSANMLGSASAVGDVSDELLPAPTHSSTPIEPPETGGEALALFLASSSCRLQTLKLAWNTMKGYPAKMLMQYISYNHTLTYLDLSCNGLGPIAGEILGDALITNKTLRTLLVNNNQFSASATVSICIGITENFSLHHIELNENPIGMLGGKMIMANAVSWGSRVVVEAKNCNTTMAFDDRAEWFDPTNPCQDFHLHLAKPLHRAIAIYLLHLVATHSTYIVQSATLEPPKGKVERLEFVQGIARDREEYFDEEQKKVIAGLRLIASAASNMELAKELFYEADADRSGKLDKDELQEVLEKIGFPIDVDRLNDIFAVFDVDGAGSIDMSEFVLLLKAQAREAHARIREMTEYPITALKPAASTSSTVIPSQKYIPPRHGILHLSITDGFVQKEHFLTMSTIDQKFAYHMAKRIGDVSWMNEAVRNTKMRYDEGLALYKTLFRELQDTPQALMQVIPQMMFPSESRQLIAKVTKNIPREIARVKLAFGVALRPLLGAFNGYYCLDLSKEIHRLCLSRLLEQSQTWNFHQRRSTYNIIGPSKIGDVSQHGNWSCFRNERMQGQPIKITPQRFQPMPHSGTVEFDFACAPKRSGTELIMSDKRVCKVLSNLAILPMENFTDGVNKCNAWRKKSQEKSRDGSLFMPIYAFDPRKAVEAGKSMDTFYDSLPDRQNQLRQGKKKEVGLASSTSMLSPSRSRSSRSISKKMDSNANASDDDSEDGDDDDDSRSTASSSSSSSSRSSSSSSSSGSSSSSSTSSSSTSPKSKDNKSESAVTNNETTEIPPAAEETENEDTADENEEDAEDEENQQRRRLEAKRKRLMKLLYSKKSNVSPHGKAVKLLEVIEDTFGQLWIYTRHVALIVYYFQQIFNSNSNGMENSCIGASRDFGSYAVELIVMLFGRIVDLHNFELLFSLLDAKDCGALFCRLGMMMLFNPMKPEVTYELDMDRREERLLAKLIVYLSVVEPGINLTYKQFQWKREMDYIPGWELTDMWCTEEGMPIHGKLVFTYYSGEGRNKSGCIPDVFLRKALCAMTVIDEEAATRDEDAEIPLEQDAAGKRIPRAGEKHYNENKDIWINYLSVAAERDGSDGRYV